VRGGCKNCSAVRSTRIHVPFVWWDRKPYAGTQKGVIKKARLRKPRECRDVEKNKSVGGAKEAHQKYQGLDRFLFGN